MDLLFRVPATLLRLVLAATLGLLVVLQTLSFPGQFAHMAEEHPDDAHLRWPLTAFAFVEILCVQVVIVCTWKLLTMVLEDRIFTDEALRWVDRIIAAIAAGWLLLAGLFLYVGFTADDPGAPIVLLLALLVWASVGLLVPVLRRLLEQATALRTDMEGVI